MISTDSGNYHICKLKEFVPSLIALLHTFQKNIYSENSRFVHLMIAEHKKMEIP